jgi:galactokinase
VGRGLHGGWYAVWMNAIEDPLVRASRLFRESFGREPTHAAVAPGRVNLIGEHTDYNGGLVLPIAIDRACAAVGAFGDEPGMVRLVSGDVMEEVEGVGARAMFAAHHALEPENFAGGGGAGVSRPVRWWSYVAGVIGEHARLVNECPPPGVSWPHASDIAICSSVPSGSGLSSSAALEVAVLMLIEQISKPPMQLHPAARIEVCRAAEHKYARVPCGVMDQTIACLGKAGHAVLIDCKSGETEVLAMPGGVSVVVFDSGVRHSLAGGEYAKRRAACEAAAKGLGVAMLRDATIEDLIERRSALSEEEFKAAKHVILEIGRTQEAAEILRAGAGRDGLRRLGVLMNESHFSLKDEFRVSCEELDVLAAAARSFAGVYGARMTGGGFGGCVIALCDAGAAKSAREAVGLAFRTKYGRDCESYVTAAGEGARVVAVA